MVIDTRFQQIADRMDHTDKKIKKLTAEINKAEVAVSQYRYELDRINGVVKQLVLVTSVLQQRTGGKIENDELKKEYDRIEADVKARQSTTKSGKI